jgi:GDP-L-fucose synthase
MRIAVIGAKGFVGRSLAGHLLHNHHITPITRDTLNLLDSVAVRQFLEKNKFDVIVNCAAVMTDNSSLNDARNNFGMFMNFYDNRSLFGKFINTASGAEFDRSMNIDNLSESEIFNRMPNDSYGWGQNMKARICAQTDNFYNIRIFNCFGRGEIATRIFPIFLEQGKIEITNNRYFDYFSIQDLQRVVEDCVDKNWSIKDVNAVYPNKVKISQAMELFCQAHNLPANITVLSESSMNYTGSGETLSKLDIKLEGLEQGFKNYL